MVSAEDGPLISYSFNDALMRKVLDGITGLQDFTVPLERCGLVAMRSVDENFASGGRPTQWDVLSPTTLALRTGGGGGGQPLRDTGKLMQSVTVTAQGFPGNLYRLTPNELVLGTNLPYAAIHQFGGVVTAKKAKVLAKEITPAQAEVLQSLGRPTSVNKSTGQVFAIFGKSVRIAPRPFLVLHELDFQKFRRIFQDWIAAQIGGAS